MKSNNRKKALNSLYAAGLFLGSCGCAGHTAPVANVAAPDDNRYQLASVQRAGVAQTIKLPAQLAAFQEVSIFPKVNGYVKEVMVDIGSHVRKGQLLMVLEAPELAQAAIQAREKYARAKQDYTIGLENYERMKKAASTPGAVAPMSLANAQAKVAADSALCNAEKANWQMQLSILEYLRVTAPFDGVISERNVHPGALVSAEAKDGRPMLELREVDHLRLQVDIPEGIAANMRDRDTISFYLAAFPGKRLTGEVRRRSGVVNNQDRSERMEVDVYNRDGRLAPGMYGDILFRSAGNPDAWSVPKSAVVTSTERKYVLCVRNGKTVKVDIATGNESADRVEVTGELAAGDQLVLHAAEDIREGVVINAASNKSN